ncbi:MAG TPA: hypothetical protein VHX42_00785 [Candidatus Babeliales bacterium]|jgi:hypothetical protein|nr:hypothetical protein [Candidatus Babeliales bacterium]
MIPQNHYLKKIIPSLLFVFSLNFPMSFPFIEQRMIKQRKKIQQAKRKHAEKLQAIKNLKTVEEVDTAIHEIKNGIYKEIITEIASLTNRPYDLTKHLFDAERNIVKKLLQSENPYITQKHSKDIPSSMYNDIISVLQEAHIDPKNVTLKYSPNGDEGLLASAKGATFNSHLYPYFKKPRIRLYAAVNDRPKVRQLFVYSHELYHILLRHSSMKIKTAIYHSNGIHNSNIDNLISIQEREADIHAASKNRQMAHAGMISRCTSGHSEIINEKKHCYDMQVMHELMKQKEKLSQQ